MPDHQQQVAVTVEVRISAQSRSEKQAVRDAAWLQLSRKTMFRQGRDDSMERELAAMGVDRVWVEFPSSSAPQQHEELAYFRSSVQLLVYRTHHSPAHEERTQNEHDGTSTTLYSQYVLPHARMENIWETLVLRSGVKDRLLNYSATSLLFARQGVDPTEVCCNRVFVFHGPPGSGKTSLCQALAQKLAVRQSQNYPQGVFLLQVNANALFSRFFSESGKLVNKLFECVRELASNAGQLVILHIDEVESLTSSRSKVSQADPSDAVRVVNAMLTQIDLLRAYTNVLLFATSNLTQQIDPAFLDRADVVMFLGNPDASARFHILQSCLDALVRAGVVSAAGGKEHHPHPQQQQEAVVEMSENLQNACTIAGAAAAAAQSAASSSSSTTTDWLWKAAVASDGMSGRALRKMPFQAHAFYVQQGAAGGGPTPAESMARAFYCCIQDHKHAGEGDDDEV